MTNKFVHSINSQMKQKILLLIILKKCIFYIYLLYLIKISILLLLFKNQMNY